MKASRRQSRGFTLVEMLVVVGIIGVLVSLLVPALGRVRASSSRLSCGGNLRQIGMAIVAYAADNRGSIPYGPQAQPMSFFNFYPVTGNVTSLISIESGAPCGLGMTLKRYLAATPKVLFCPGTDQDSIADQELNRFGKAQAQSDYYYRHGSGGDSYAESPTTHLRLADLGLNNDGNPITALAMDVQFIADPGLGPLNIFTRSAHERKWSNILFSDGHVSTATNADDRFTVDSRIFLARTFGFILKAMERADREQ